MKLGQLKANTEKRKGCLIWCGAQMAHTKTGRRYGVIRDGRSHRNTYVHRYAYELNHGNIPFGMTVVHSCGQTLCVNPKHLKLASRSEIAKKDWEARKNRKTTKYGSLVCPVCEKKVPKIHPNQECCCPRCTNIRRSRRFYDKHRAQG